MLRAACNAAAAPAKEAGVGALPPPENGASLGHMQLVHRLHSADAEDAWLQREWGEILAAQERPEEAAVHLEVGPAILHAAWDLVQPCPNTVYYATAGACTHGRLPICRGVWQSSTPIASCDSRQTSVMACLHSILLGCVQRRGIG